MKGKWCNKISGRKEEVENCFIFESRIGLKTRNMDRKAPQGSEHGKMEEEGGAMGLIRTLRRQAGERM